MKSICNMNLEYGELKFSLDLRVSVFLCVVQFHACINLFTSKGMYDWNIINCIHF